MTKQNMTEGITFPWILAIGTSMGMSCFLKQHEFEKCCASELCKHLRPVLLIVRAGSDKNRSFCLQNLGIAYCT